jgi:D-serine deaminase-like pyridoxal phosphate-dependent protein
MSPRVTSFPSVRPRVAVLPRLHEVDTPALTVAGPTLVSNVGDMAARARMGNVELWPHSKTHKSLAVASLQREQGIAGLTTATVREAETFAAGGIEDILIAFPPVGARLPRVVELSRKVRLRVVLDNAEVADALDEACRQAGTSVGYLWEVECGTGRIGTEPGETAARAIAPVASRTRHARFAGLMAFAGHAYGAETPEEIGDAAEGEGRAVYETAAALALQGVEVQALSVGTTPTTNQLEREGPVTEIRPGNYVFYDATQVLLGVASPEQCALSVLATVVARPTPHRLILDAGSKALAAETLSPRTRGFGFVVGHPELYVARLYEEHTIVTCEEPSTIRIGERLAIVPNHACACINLHDRMLVVEDGEVVDVWSIDARGWTT